MSISSKLNRKEGETESTTTDEKVSYNFTKWIDIKHEMPIEECGYKIVE